MPHIADYVACGISSDWRWLVPSFQWRPVLNMNRDAPPLWHAISTTLLQTPIQ